MRNLINFILAHLLLELMVNLSLAQNQQQQCTNRMAIRNMPEIAQQLANVPTWYVGRVTVLQNLPPNIPRPTINTCAPLSYLQACGGGAIRIRKQYSNGFTNSISQMTSAYNAQDQTIVNYFEDRTLIDPNFFVYSGSISLMHIYQQVFGQAQLVFQTNSNYPPLVSYTEGSQYAMTFSKSINGDILWAVYEDCQRDLTWIEVNYAVVENNLVAQVNQQIDEFLNQPQNYKIPQMVQIDVELPFVTPDEVQ